ncbi:COP9 signalosome complex subunit 6a-like [Macadamia integrifolia]|uniref:COP9 signalosome complex subunit 6a-like n=1 Tax=Macadamia integrifolia TaxID=60698 RepID=UPI001C4EC51E|nr:COP9 signalosome complex subunit 6a-like [Macadamia integrifolia]
MFKVGLAPAYRVNCPNRVATVRVEQGIPTELLTLIKSPLCSALDAVIVSATIYRSLSKRNETGGDVVAQGNNSPMASSSSSGLTFKLHPLVIVNISDHYTRVKSQTHFADAKPNGGASPSHPSPPPRVFGCVIGVQRGRTVEIFNSFELLCDPSTDSLDRPFLEKKQELYKKVFPNFYILGWYSTGNDAQESDMSIHKAVSSRIFLF